MLLFSHFGCKRIRACPDGKDWVCEILQSGVLTDFCFFMSFAVACNSRNTTCHAELNRRKIISMDICVHTYMETLEVALGI